MTNLDSILKIRDITLLTKVCLVKAIIFPEIFNFNEVQIIHNFFLNYIFDFLSKESSPYSYTSCVYFPRLVLKYIVGGGQANVNGFKF